MPKFEESIKELEKIVKALEDGEPTLDESLKSFEKGKLYYKMEKYRSATICLLYTSPSPRDRG